MVMTEWMKAVKKALETVPKDTPNRLRTAMEKAKLTYKKSSSSSHHAAASHSMKKSHKRHRGRSGKGRKGKSMRKSHRSRKHYKGGMPKLSPSDYEGGQNVGTSGPGVQMRAAMSST
jgi:hypothetical protein